MEMVIEHNLDVIKSADYIIDLRPEGGNECGQIVAEGTPEEVARVEESHTGRFLQGRLLNPNSNACSLNSHDPKEVCCER